MKQNLKNSHVYLLLNRLNQEYRSFGLLLRSTPPLMLSLLILAIFAMDLMANKSIALPVSWLALDCGLVVSWFVFLAMDILTKHFGAKAATELSLLAVAVHLIACLLFYIVSILPGTWSAAIPEAEAIINSALDQTFGGTWYIILGSTAAFASAALVNNFLNEAVGRLFSKNPDGLGAYLCRSYVSTAIGQFVDNLIFSLLVSRLFFGWTMTQCLTCSLFGMGAELLFEVVFSPIGYRVCRRWQRDKVGVDYIRESRRSQDVL